MKCLCNKSASHIFLQIVDDQDQSEDDDDDDQYPGTKMCKINVCIFILFLFKDGASQVSSLLQAAVPTFKTSPGSTSDSGIGKSVFNTETKSILSEFAQVCFNCTH